MAHKDYFFNNYSSGYIFVIIWYTILFFGAGGPYDILDVKIIILNLLTLLLIPFAIGIYSRKKWVFYYIGFYLFILLQLY